VYTAFSGSHQDAIKKGMRAQQQQPEDAVWDVPYLPIDPQDVGRTYEAIIRVNSQSGKGGISYLLASRYGLELPRDLQGELAQKVQAITDAEGGELAPEEIYDLFRSAYLDVAAPYELGSYTHEASESGDRLTGELRVEGEPVEIQGHGNGPIAALVDALVAQTGTPLRVLDYHEHAMSSGADASAAAYVEADVDGELVWGVGIHPSIVTASLRAVVNGLNRALLLSEQQEAALRAFGSGPA
jgi:2-isopropylmalate synthase